MTQKTNSDQWKRKIHDGLFRRWYLANVKMTTIAYRFGCSVASLKAARKRLGLPARRTGAPVAHRDIKPPEPRMDLKKGDLVVITNPENPVFYGMPAYVDEPTPWGAILAVPVFHHGKPSTRVPYRATFAEMTLYRDVPAPAVAVVSVTRTVSVVTGMGYTGSICIKCQSSRMVRSGACERCEDCGDTTGCG